MAFRVESRIPLGMKITLYVKKIEHVAADLLDNDFFHEDRTRSIHKNMSQLYKEKVETSFVLL
jgi:hypothetical protein